jgi:hypothetical protein
MRFKVEDAYDAVYGYYHAQAVDEGVEWTAEHDEFVGEVTGEFISYIRESINNFFNVETPTLPGLYEKVQ